MHRPVIVRKGHPFDGFPLLLGRQADHVNLLPGQHAAEAVHPGSAVVIAADHHDFRPGQCPGQARHEAVEGLHRLGGGHGLVVNIPGDHHRLRLQFRRPGHDLPQDKRLILPQIPVHQFQANV